MLISGTGNFVEFEIESDSILPMEPPSRRQIAAAAAQALWPFFDLMMIPDRTFIVSLLIDGSLYTGHTDKRSGDAAYQSAVFMTKIDTALVATGGPVPYIFRRPA